MAVCAWVHGTILVLGTTADKHRVIGMSLDVLLQVLGALERLAAEVALVRLEWDMNADVRRDVVTLDRRSATGTPLARQVEVVGALATDVLLTQMVLGLSASSPSGLVLEDSLT
jgi:hypothetical protein